MRTPRGPTDAVQGTCSTPGSPLPGPGATEVGHEVGGVAERAEVRMLRRRVFTEWMVATASLGATSADNTYVRMEKI